MRIAVIGTGVSGLVALKWLKQAGLDVVAFEQRQALGGVWNLKQGHGDYDSPAYPGLSMNTSRRITGFSDFQYPFDPGFYPTREQVNAFLTQYAQQNQLQQSVRLNTHIKLVEPDNKSTWRISGVCQDQAFEEGFDGVVVCTGRHQYPSFPDTPDRRLYAGQVQHSVSYQGPESYRGQRVLLVGCGASAADIGYQLSRVCSKVVVSVKSGRWIIPRLIKGKPLDYYLTRFFQALPYGVRMAMMRYAIVRELKHLGLAMDDSGLGLPQPAFDFRVIRLTLNTDFLMALKAGAISIKPEIQGFDGDTVCFQDGTQESIDTILYATGYQIRFPFLPSLSPVTTEGDLNLFRYIFSPDHSKLAFIGMVNVQGPFPPVFEMQARWVSQIFSGRQALPSAQDMMQDIDARQARRSISGGRPALVQYFSYLEDIAREMGVRPRWWLHPRYYRALLFEPIQAWHYRLEGSDALKDKHLGEVKQSI